MDLPSAGRRSAIYRAAPRQMAAKAFISNVTQGLRRDLASPLGLLEAQDGEKFGSGCENVS